MARKEKKYHYIYKTTCIKNEKYYIGMHSTDNLEDGYMGSGKRLRRSLNKYGKENFKFEILEFLPDRETLKERERELINEELLKDSLSMNIKLGGEGGFISDEHQIKCSLAGKKAYLDKLKNDEDFRSKLKKIGVKTYKNLKGLTWGDTCRWLGRTHKEESKKKMSEKAKLRTDEKSSQFGTCWITNGKENKKIKKEELNNYLCNGWDKGRKMKIL